MNPRACLPLLSLEALVLLAGGCGVDSSMAGGGGGGGGMAASSSSEATAEARAALAEGAGSVGDCNGNPARCAAVSLGAGWDHTLALRADGAAWAFGDNSHGELGDETLLPRKTPVQVSGESGLGSAAAVTAGSSFTAALKSDGTVWTWGYNNRGQLGDGTILDRLAPTKVNGVSGIVALAAGAEHTVALGSDGTVWAWGHNNHGQLGATKIAEQHTPMAVSGVSGVTAVATGSNHTVVLKSDGTVWAWGRNDVGQLGDSSTTSPQSPPVSVSGLTGITAVTAGGDHTVALKSDGTVWAWGRNDIGQLGDSTTTDRVTPVRVKELTSVVAVTAGGEHSLALKSDGTVWAWGGNDAGQLGDGTLSPRSTPVRVSELHDIVAVEAGIDHSVALGSDGTVWGWGQNKKGQLGDDTTTNRLVPVRVSGLNLSPTCSTATASCDAATGQCASHPLVCSASDSCHEPGTCDMATGACTNPAKPEGSPCDDRNACTRIDSCHAGACTAGTPVVCADSAPDDCHEPGTCEPATGTCSTPAKPDDTPCSIGTCQAGTCKPTIDLSCRFTAPGSAASKHAWWLAAAVLLAVRRRRPAVPRARPRSL